MPSKEIYSFAKMLFLILKSKTETIDLFLHHSMASSWQTGTSTCGMLSIFFLPVRAVLPVLDLKVLTVALKLNLPQPGKQKVEFWFWFFFYLPETWKCYIFVSVCVITIICCYCCFNFYVRLTI